MQLWGPGDSDNQWHTRLLIQTSESRSVQYRPRALIRASTRSGQSNQQLHWDAMNLRVGLSHRDDESDERFDTNSPRTHEEEPGMHSNHLYILVTPLILQITFEQVSLGTISMLQLVRICTWLVILATYIEGIN